nr:MAG: hypothetical protein [Caudoviricetes sp.]
MVMLTKKDLEKYLKSIKEDVPVKVHCGFNQYHIKRVVLYDGNIILEVGEVENLPEEYVDEPSVA